MMRNLWLQSLVLACLTATGCNRGQTAAGPPKPPEVIVAYPVMQMVTEFEEFPGRLDAVNTVQIKARVPGYLTEIHFIDGQTGRGRRRAGHRPAGAL